MIAYNQLPEFVFGILDRLVRIRPNASTLANEAFLLYSYNKTGKWLQDLPEEKRITDKFVNQKLGTGIPKIGHVCMRIMI